ncbi:MAG: tetratricopeptide repeat protein [candidate division KSB1 bacterium]|nr:tetratricopeptide repeat protein [candidate division KSB1 bacterium]
MARYPQHRLASNCWYWIGESYFALGDLNNALQAFNEVLNYRNSFKTDDALLMLGRIYMRQGNAEMARQMFNRLQQDYPDSEYVPRAQRYLNQLR